VLPRFAVGMLLARKLVAADNPHDAIFTSRRGTWLSPNNVRRQWRQARADTDLAWVTPHTFRKTVATLINEEANTKSASAQLGHSSEEVTDTYYIPSPFKPRTSPTSLSDSAPTRRTARTYSAQRRARMTNLVPYPRKSGVFGGRFKTS
jgi:integrase